MDDILAHYGLLLKEVDEWFAHASRLTGSDVSCRKGCSACCRGLFDITLLDACYLANGFVELDALKKKTVLSRAKGRLLSLQTIWPELTEPYILNYRPEADWDELMPEEDETPCVLLGDDGKCLVYDYRPMTCRLNGIPLVDHSGEVFFEDWCTLNFIGRDPLAIKELRGEFRRIFADELRLFQQFTYLICNQQLNELDTFIPTALLIDFAGFDWLKWQQRTSVVENPPCCE
jgi:Fe-S-cluster containining protein